MILYEAHFEERDGEYEYTTKVYVVANDLSDAVKYFDDMLLEWWEDNTQIYKFGSKPGRVVVEQADGYRVCEVGWITPVHGFNAPSTDGRNFRVNFEVKEVKND